MSSPPKSQAEHLQEVAELVLQEQEQDFRTLAETVPQVVWATRADGWTTYFNKNWVDYTGLTLEESYGHGWKTAFHPDDRQHVWEAWQRATIQNTPYSLECRLRGADGLYRWWLIRGAAVRNAKGEIQKWFGTCTDIEDLKRSEVALQQTHDALEQRVIERTEQLRQSELRYLAIGDSIDYGVWVCAPDGRNIYASPSFLKLVGLTQEQCSSFGWGDVLHPDDAARTIAAWKECVRTGGVWDIEHSFRGVDGEYHPVLARGVPIRDEKGEVRCWAGINLDISRLKQAEEALRRSEERYRKLFDTLIEGFCVIEMVFDAESRPVDYRFLEVNPAFERQTGLCNVQGKLIRELVADNEPHWFEIYGRVALTGAPARFENEARALNRWYEVSAFRVGGEGSRRVAILFNDITERKQAEVALRDSEERFRTLADGTFEGVAIVEDGRLVDVNMQLAHMLGYPADELRGMKLAALVSPTDRKRVLSHIRARSPRCIEFVFMRKNGKPILVESRGLTISYHGRLARIKAIRDITEYKRMEAVLQQTNARLEARVAERTAELTLTHQKLLREAEAHQQLQQQVIDSSETDQRLLGAAVHDGLCAQLAALRYANDTLHKRLLRTSPKAAAQTARMDRFIADTLTQARNLALMLNPVELEEEGLMAALIKLAARTKEHYGLSVRVTCPYPVLVSDHSTAIHLFRIAQEAVRNAVTHGKASRITLGLSQKDGTLRLTVVSNGRNFPKRLRRGPGMGLHNMRFRATSIGAQLTIRPRPQGGTRVACSWPLARPTSPNPRSVPRNR